MISTKTEQQTGLTLVEIMVAATLALVLLAGFMAFFINTTKSMQMGQQQAESISKTQVALSRMVKELKEAHTESPPLFAVSPNWSQLPALPYLSYESYPYDVTSGTVVIPAVPALRLFEAQDGETNILYKWHPNPGLDQNASNSLVFYNAPPPAPGAVSEMQRITYRLDTAIDSPQLVREVQSPLTSGSTNFQASPAPLRSVLVDNVEKIHFRYPLLERQMAVDGVNFNNQLQDILTNQGVPALQQYLNQNFRKVILITLVLRGAKMGNGYAKGIELETEVRLRNE